MLLEEQREGCPPVNRDIRLENASRSGCRGHGQMIYFVVSFEGLFQSINPLVYETLENSLKCSSKLPEVPFSSLR